MLGGLPGSACEWAQKGRGRPTAHRRVRYLPPHTPATPREKGLGESGAHRVQVNRSPAPTPVFPGPPTTPLGGLCASSMSSDHQTAHQVSRESWPQYIPNRPVLATGVLGSARVERVCTCPSPQPVPDSGTLSLQSLTPQRLPLAGTNAHPSP